MSIPSWITLSQNSGQSGQTDVTFTASTNNTSRARTAVLKVRNPNSGLEKNVTIRQESYYYNIPLTIEVVSGSGLFLYEVLGKDISPIVQPIQYSKNGGEWQTFYPFDGEEGENGISVQQGDVIRLKGNNPAYANSGEPLEKFTTFNTRAAAYVLDPQPIIDVYGNIMSLIYGDNFIGNNTLTEPYTFRLLFENGVVRNAENLILPSTVLTEGCYSGMFQYLPSPPVTGTVREHHLITAPELPATTLAQGCYTQMFAGAHLLTKAPSILPATTLVQYCYSGMFWGCTSLTTAPELPATTLAQRCYDYMFYDCANLNYIKCLALEVDNISVVNSTHFWVYGVGPTGTFVKNVNMNSWPTGKDGIPSGWTVENAEDYLSMPLTFDITDDGVIKWFYTNSDSGASRTIEYSKNGGTWTPITSTDSGVQINVVSGDTVQFKGDNANYGTVNSSFSTFEGSTCQFSVKGNIMSLINSTNFSNLTILPSAFTFTGLFQYCDGLTDASRLILPATACTQECYEYMFRGSSLSAAPQMLATTMALDCCYSMFRNCTNLTTAPELLATTLANGCYERMFYSCINLNYIKCLATDISASNCTNGWVNGVASAGTFVKDPNMSGWSTGNNGIPTNWTVQEIT